ncbi:pentapeptide repeat-containing protein [Thalassospira sp. MA62]|nr:pentapeptide repeat-containing protein [Thalassospira sp. MA62]
MNQKQTLALFRQGEDAWNAWANVMRAKRKELEESGKWQVNRPFHAEQDQWLKEARVIFSSENSPYVFRNQISFKGWIFPSTSDWTAATFEQDAPFNRSIFEGYAGFSGATFKGYAGFSGATFEGYAGFSRATFEGYAAFSGMTFKERAAFNEATFYGGAVFDGTTFKMDAMFDGTTFKKNAVFNGSLFKGYTLFSRATFKETAAFGEATFDVDVVFHGTTFSGRAWFNSSCFEKPANFSNARFIKVASFNSAQIKQTFDLSGARFLEVPDFRQTHCEEAPLLDDVQIESTIIKQRSMSEKPDFTVTANYRSLKRLAIQGHDHRHEVEFFAEELRSKRLMVDTKWGWNWVLSGLFQITSDYGRSILRPFLFWLLIAGLSAVLYLLTAAQSASEVALHCVKGDGEQWVSAIQLAIAKGLLLPGIADRTLITQAYNCLYGGTIPHWASAVLGLQTLVSSALLFLLLLGIRNRFKLK